MANYKKISVAEAPRTELHDSLGLTGAEISINELPAGASVPFVHAHKHNEEIYAVLSRKGQSGHRRRHGRTERRRLGAHFSRRQAAVFCLSPTRESAICASKSGRTL